MSLVKTVSGAALGLIGVLVVLGARWWVREDPFLRDIDGFLAGLDIVPVEYELVAADLN